VVLIFSIPGLLVYMILRPRYTLDDAFQRSLEEEYLMQDLAELPLCPGCQQYVEDEWVFCPNCRTELRDNCVACDRLIDLRWEICPYCGTEQYVEDEDALPAPMVQPSFAPSPQFLGRPQLTAAQIFQITTSEEPTRPIIPATVRVDLRNGSVAREEVPELPFPAAMSSFSGIGPPWRVTLDGNGLSHITDADDVLQRHVEPLEADHRVRSAVPQTGIDRYAGEPSMETDPTAETMTDDAVNIGETDAERKHIEPVASARPRKRRRKRSGKRKSGKSN
jgi:RNA polymerase subunit RPABC4/transcription elongation factor Spt4